jgi:hypothetical protein
MTDVETGQLIPYLVDMFRFQAWIAMGKQAHPVSGKIEKDLEVSRLMIGLLDELESRTEGNRSADETKLLRATLTDLRLNYMDERKKPVEAAAPDPEEAAPEGDSPDSGKPTQESETTES